MTTRTRQAIQSEANALFVNNMSGDIEADEVLAIITDILDSVTFPTPSTSFAPVVTTFNIDNQATEVDPGTTIDGIRTFNYIISHPDNVDGDISITQSNPVATLVSDGDPTATSVVGTVQSVTLAAGEAVTFTLLGTATGDAGGGAIDTTFTIRARTLDEYVYISAETDNDPSDVVIASADRAPFVPAQQTINVPTFSGERYITILQKASEPELTQIIIDSVDQSGAFTRTANALQINGEDFDAYVSNNLMIGSLVSGDAITLVR